MRVNNERKQPKMSENEREWNTSKRNPNEWNPNIEQEGVFLLEGGWGFR